MDESTDIFIKENTGISVMDNDLARLIWGYQNDDSIDCPSPNTTGEKSLDEGKPQFHWSEEITKKFILLRHEKSHYFCGKRFLTQKAWLEILKEIGAESQLTIPQARKKWGNLVLKYKQLKGLPTQCNSPLPGRDTAETWPYFDLMDKVMGKPPAVIKPVSVVASAQLPEDKAAKPLSDIVEYLNSVESLKNMASNVSDTQIAGESVFVISPAGDSNSYQTFQIMLQDGADVNPNTIKDLLDKYEATVLGNADVSGEANAELITGDIAEDIDEQCMPGELQELLNSVQPEKPKEVGDTELGSSKEGSLMNNHAESCQEQEEEPPAKRMKSSSVSLNEKNTKPLHSSDKKKIKPNPARNERSSFLTWLQESMQRCNERQAILENQGHRLNQLFDELLQCVKSHQKRQFQRSSAYYYGDGLEEDSEEERDNL